MNVCAVCSGTWPRSDHYVADIGNARAYLHEDQFFPGWTVLVLKRHATELFHLSSTERAQLMENLAFVARCLAEELKVVKINYELLGNQVPHVHWHVVPRLIDDPAPLEPVWRISHEPRVLNDRARQALIMRLQKRFAETAP